MKKPIKNGFQVGTFGGQCYCFWDFLALNAICDAEMECYKS